MSDPNEIGQPEGTGQPEQPAADPVTEAQTDAAQAQAEADKALADPQADLNHLLDDLRTIEVQLFGIEVVRVGGGGEWDHWGDWAGDSVAVRGALRLPVAY